MEAGCDFILLKAGGSSLEIVSGATSEVLKAVILHPGEASVPEPVFRGIARVLRFYRGRTATVAASRGLLRIDRTEFRHPNISVLTSGTGQDIVGTKPAKLQNL
jgi:exopolyphosphatase/pppGpp-phosphohydrolase